MTSTHVPAEKAIASKLLVVPPAIVPYLRDGLHSEIGTAVEEISVVTWEADRAEHPEWYGEPIEHLDRVRRLLDLVGWSANSKPGEIQIDVREHSQLVLDALNTELSVVDEQLRESEQIDAGRAARGEPPQRETTAQRMIALREFVAAVEGRMDMFGSGRSPAATNSTIELGNAIRSRRRDLQLSRKQLSGLTAVPPKTIRELERDGSNVPLRVLLLIVNTLGLDTTLRSRTGKRDERQP
jgi:hypothetical protein